MPASEAELLAKAVAGDPDALSSLLLRVGPQIQSKLDRRLAAKYRSAFDIDDVMQVTYLEAFICIQRFDSEGVGSFVSWLHRIADNNLVDAIRGLDREKRPPRDKQVIRPTADDTYVTLFGNLTGTTSTPSRCASEQEAKKLLENALAKLPDDYARVVRDLDLEGCPVPEVATALGRSTGAVHMLRARAHDRLKDLLGTASRFFTDSP